MAKVELTPMKLACLKDAAECINPAHRSWYLNDYKRWVETYENGDAIIVCHPEQIQPALSFIAEADPATVLALLDELTDVRMALLELAWEFYGRGQTREEIESCCAVMVENERASRKESEAGHGK